MDEVRDYDIALLLRMIKKTTSASHDTNLTILNKELFKSF